MGAILGRNNVKKSENTRNVRSDRKGERKEQYEETTQQIKDKIEVDLLDTEFEEQPDIFILNQLLMSFMFYKRPDEIHKYSKRKVVDVNSVLLKEHQKSCIKVDHIAELVNEYIEVKPNEGSKKDACEPLLPRRMFILHYNIEVIPEEEVESNLYCGIDKPTCKVKLISYEKRKGYVRLKLIPDGESKLSLTSKAGSETSINSANSEDNNEDEYGRINDARTPKPLTIENRFSQTLPRNIFKPYQLQSKKDYEPPNNDDQRGDKIVYYLDSREFMKHFRENNIQPSLLKLDFNRNDIEKALYTELSVFCNNTEEGQLVNWEIIPAISIPWPDAYFYEFCENRKTRPLKKIGNVQSQWPRKKMMENIEIMDCVALPRGYLSKYKENKFNHVEWEVAFPLQERYLESTLEHVRVRQFLFYAAIYKKFIEPVSHKKGILIDHIRNHLFWEMERDVLTGLRSNKLGTKMMMSMEKLYDCLGRSELKDYFVESKNLFENIPGMYMRSAQKEIHDIIERPVMYFISALKNLQYKSTSFYPYLDLDKLCDILTIRIKDDNPRLYKELVKETLEKSAQKRKDDGPLKDSVNLEWSYKKNKISAITDIYLVNFFIDHFMKIVEFSFNIGELMQAKLYVKQAFYLQELLNKKNVGNSSNDKAIKEWEKNIATKSRNSDVAPDIPTRNSILSRTNHEEVDRQRHSTINLMDMLTSNSTI